MVASPAQLRARAQQLVSLANSVRRVKPEDRDRRFSLTPLSLLSRVKHLYCKNRCKVAPSLTSPSLLSNTAKIAI
jgi:hypothetical protein